VPFSVNLKSFSDLGALALAKSLNAISASPVASAKS
jgi:hypothetical protein